MIGRRTVIGLSLLSALVFCAFAAQSASAAAAKNTTAFTCIAKAEGDFKDAHCDEKVEPGKGSFAHAALTGSPTEIQGTNEDTAGNPTTAVLTGVAAGVPAEITCKTVHATGNIENKQTGTEHQIKGTLTTLFENCQVDKPAKCQVLVPIEVKAVYEGVEGALGGGAIDEMGVEFKPHEGETFVQIVFGNDAECALKNAKLKVTGTAIATGTPPPTKATKHTGVTSNFTKAMTEKTLKFAGNAASFELSTTVRMKDVGGVKQPGIALTTVT
jgi:hypothetical protein